MEGSSSSVVASSSKQSDSMDVDEDMMTTPKPVRVIPATRPRANSLPLVAPDYAVGYIYSSEMMAHFCPSGHPEQPLRIQSIWQCLKKAGLTDKMKWLPIRAARKGEALLVHSEDHWNKVVAFQHMTEQQRADSEHFYDAMSLYVVPMTTRSSLLSCGGVIEAALAVARGELKKTFAIVRPPGHHAEPDEHMGFCFFNNVAVAARVVQMMTPVKKILILDWDVHHGNGTQRAFDNDPSVLYMSIHRYDRGEFYPCGPYGAVDSCGEGAGEGYSVNVPWPGPEMGDADYLYAFQKVIMPIALEFAPDLVIIAAGFDAAAGDELGECDVTPAGYAHMTHMLAGLAGGRMVVALEGGYNLKSISDSALAVTQILLGQAPEQLPPLQACEQATETVWLVARQQSKYWKSVDPKSCEPRQDVERISFDLPDILKKHRQYYLSKEHDMMQIPLLTPDQEDRFATQVMCSSDIFSNKTLVVFAHEFGNLRMELESSAVCDAHLERSYLIDVSKDVIDWVKRKGYAILDANLYSKPSDTLQVAISKAARGAKTKIVETPVDKLLMYLWDNYIQLSGADKIVFIGHGPGCKPLIDLLNTRAQSIKKSVKAIVQVVGPQIRGVVPRAVDDMREWYHARSLLVMSASHPMMTPIERPKDLRKHGFIVPVEEPRQIKLMSRALPAIEQFVAQMLSKPAQQAQA
ncbi:histone deacetylase clr3 [Crepidotus variabilis]|uniref:histone deacetylase n=1 Tax=Crepidotus variabilis TaxID=179855 RepID=A0A9P6JQM9_9AGAR|nr:histone deacetylase clr3 [Crepidotus variabilis]